MRPKSLGHSLTGLIILLIGSGFLLDSFNVWDFRDILKVWWPTIIIAIGLASLVSNQRRPVTPAIIIGVGILLLLKSTGVVDFNVWQIIWPTALILVGASLLFHHSTAPVADTDKAIDVFAAFSGNVNANASDDFRGGRLTALFGGVELDLRKAAINKQASIDIFVAFGGAELKVPVGWKVVTKGLPIFGGWEDKTAKPTDPKAPTLELRGSCLFGGVEIHN